MDEMIDKELVKEFRKKQSWSQDQLASVSGLSHRTIQRIENEGSCSLDSKKALAAAFDINANELNINTAAIAAKETNSRGRKFGFYGAALGLACSYAGVTHSLTNGYISAGEAGLYYGGIGAFCGISCAIVGVLSNKFHSDAV